MIPTAARIHLRTSPPPALPALGRAEDPIEEPSPSPKLCAAEGVLACVRALRRSIPVVFLVLVAMAGTSSAAVARLPTWHVVEQQAFGIAKSGPYVLLGWETGTAQLIDGQTGKRVVLRPRAGCSFDDGYSTPLGGSWVVTVCHSGSFELYSIPSRRWIPFSPDVEQMFALSGICANRYPPLCDAQYVTIGDQWIEFDVSYGYHSGPTVPTYERIKSRQITTNPPGVKPGGNQILDLDSPNLTRTLCDPLRMPVPSGTIVTDGGFAIDEESAPPEYVRHTYLERCGSSLHEPIGTDVSSFTADAQAVVWSAGGSSNELDGLLLASRRRLTLRLPQPVASLCRQKGSVCIAGLALTGRALYVSASNGQIWAAANPLVRSATTPGLPA